MCGCWRTHYKCHLIVQTLICSFCFSCFFLFFNIIIILFYFFANFFSHSVICREELKCELTNVQQQDGGCGSFLELYRFLTDNNLYIYIYYFLYTFFNTGSIFTISHRVKRDRQQSLTTFTKCNYLFNHILKRYQNR